MIFGIDIVGIIVQGLPLLFPALVGFVPQALGASGEWAACIAQHGLTAQVCQGM